jgi:hypothetical protein
LLRARFAILVLAKRREGVARALKVTPRDIVQKQGGLAVSTPGRAQTALDGRLVVSQPREVGVEIVFIKAPRKDNILYINEIRKILVTTNSCQK